MTDIDLDDLERKARAAQDDSFLPGEEPSNEECGICGVPAGSWCQPFCSEQPDPRPRRRDTARDELAPAARPSAVLYLVAWIRAAEARIAKLESELDEHIRHEQRLSEMLGAERSRS